MIVLQRGSLYSAHINIKSISFVFFNSETPDKIEFELNLRVLVLNFY